MKPDRRNPPPPGITPPAAPGLSLVVEDGMATFTARQAGVVIAIGIAVLALLNAQGLWNWASRLPASSLAEAVFAFSQFWLDLMERLRLTDAMAALRAAFELLRSL